ncbi:MAG: peptidase S10 [Acidobacteriota bacterium]|nr:peptidase S10 [Acidobacteriota bacterium]
MIISILLSVLFLFQTPNLTPTPTPTPQTMVLQDENNRQSPNTTPTPTPIPKISIQIGDPQEDKKLKLDEPTVTTRQSVRINGRSLNYKVTTGFLPIRDVKTGETEAKIFYMAYTLEGANKKRPLMFSFNGGPGSSSVWLHLGALGPKRVKMLDNGFMPPPPYELVDNEATWLTETDLVFIDPIGTGFSRALDEKTAAKFFSLQGDIQSIGEFIRLYLSRNERWSSPLFLVGESYGTTRAAGLSGYLIDRGIAFNGIALISSVLNFQSIRFADSNDLPLSLIFPSYTATAWYHKRLPADLQSKPLEQVLRESENFVMNEYTPSLLKIDRLSANEKQTLLDKFSRYSGLSKTFIDQNDFRIELSEFMKELLRDQRKVTGRLDSRFTGINKDAAGDNPEFDPSMSAIRSPYTATFNDYVRRELNFKTDLEYYILGGGIGRWNWNQDNGYAETSSRLRSALQQNPYMKVFVASGYYDMATPYFATEYTLSNMNLDPELRKNISVKYYEAGHMVYIEKVSLDKLKLDITAFIKSSVR